MTDARKHPFEDRSSEYDCSECNYLLEALRDMEQQCREVETARFDELKYRSETSYDQLVGKEHVYQIRMKALEQRRDYALELLMKHQRLEHLE